MNTAQDMSVSGERLREILTAAEKATPGPWQLGRLGDEVQTHVVDFGKPTSAPFMAFPPYGVAHTDDPTQAFNAIYIACLAPEVITTIITELLALRQTKEAGEPVAWMRKWLVDDIDVMAMPRKDRPAGWMLRGVTLAQLIDTDVPLYASPPTCSCSDAELAPPSFPSVSEGEVESAAKALCLATGLDWDSIPETAVDDDDPGKPGDESRRYFRYWVKAALQAASQARVTTPPPRTP